MEIKQLRVFLKVADSKSFLKAAEEMYVTRQALTKTIDQLEKELQLELFVRSQKGAMMTPAGIFFYPRAATLVAEFDKLKADTMNEQRSYRPLIRISLAQGIYGHYAEQLREYGRKYSREMDLQISSCFDTDAEMLLTDKKSEITLSFTKPSENIAHTVKVLEPELVFLVNRDNPFMLNRMPSMRSLLNQPLLLFAPDGVHPLWWYDFPRSKDICCSDFEYLFTMLRKDTGILPIPRISIPDYLDFAAQLPAPAAVNSIPVYFSTLYPDHYTSLAFSLIDTLLADIFTG